MQEMSMQLVTSEYKQEERADNTTISQDTELKSTVASTSDLENTLSAMILTQLEIWLR